MRTSMLDRPRAMGLTFTEDALVVAFEDGRVLQVPLEWFPRLRSATAEQRANFRLIGRGIGIHWPDLDEDLSVQGFLLGNQARPLTEMKEPIETVLGDDGDDESPSNGSLGGPYMQKPAGVQ